jgi:hypothetical protein
MSLMIAGVVMAVVIRVGRPGRPTSAVGLATCPMLVGYRTIATDVQSVWNWRRGKGGTGG